MAILFPNWFLWMQPNILWVLGVIMFGMGVTTDASDFKNVWDKKWLVCGGVIAQFTIMPLLALGLGYTFGLDDKYLFEIIIIGCCPGGTASNVIVYLSKGNVPLSISMTLVATLLAPVVTPALIYWLLASEVDISFWMIMKVPLLVVLIPVVLGVTVRLFLKSSIEKIKPIFPAISVIGISLIVAGLLAPKHSLLMDLSSIVVLVVALHNLLGYLLGYGVAKLFGADKTNARTLAIEIGMQNSGLGAGIVSGTTAFKFLTGVPSAIFSVWHNVSGSLLARVWKKD